MRMEGIIQQPIPVALFAKLDDPDQLTVEEIRTLRLWLQTLNECHKSISLKLLSVVLNDVMTVIHLQGSSSLTLQDLLCWLDKQGCDPLHREDPAHLHWRDGLESGDAVMCNGKELVLGNLLSAQKSIDDEFKVFEIDNYPDYVVKIANNRFRLLIEDMQGQNADAHWLIRPVEKVANLEADDTKPSVDGLDREGRCVVLEKLHSPVSDIEWTSDAAELTDEDEKCALVLANHFFCMQTWRANAENISHQHLMFDSNGVLKSTRLLKKGPPNYNEWEMHCAEAAKDNPHVLAFLMSVSKLSEHKVGLYYREAVEKTLKTGEKIDFLSLPLPMDHRLLEYDAHVKQLCSKALDLIESCLKHVKTVIARLHKDKKYSKELEDDLRKKVADRLLHFYRASPAPGILAGDVLLEKVVESFSDPSWDDAVLDIVDHSAYYEEKHELMMRFNRAMLKNKANIEKK